MTTIINCTPHAINVKASYHKAALTFEPSGKVARVSVGFEKIDPCPFGGGQCETCDYECHSNSIMAPSEMGGQAIPEYRQVFGEVIDLPEPQPGTVYIVSAMVLSALAGSRSDVVAPATGHPECIRNDKGHILSVPGFVRG